MVFTWHCTHDYLGKILDYSKKSKVKVTMVDFIKKRMLDFLEVITSNKVTWAADSLPEEQATAFYHTVAQLLFLCNRARETYKH